MSFTGQPQDLPGLFAALEQRVRALENRTVSIAGGTGAHSHNGIGIDSTIVGGQADSVPPTATAADAFAGGNGAIASGGFAVALGPSSVASAGNGTAVGTASQASGTGGATAIGVSAQATGDSSVAIGTVANATADNAAALGANAVASGLAAVSIGEHSEATGKAGVAIGGQADTGTGAVADGDYSVAIGSDAVVVNDYSAVVGAQARSGDSGTDGTGCVLVGSYALGKTASHRFGIGIGGDDGLGSGTFVEADRAVAIGFAAHGSHADATALGPGAVTTNSHQIQLGTAAERTIMGAPNSAIASGDLANGQISFYLDESGNTLTVKVKYSTGTVKTGTVALV